ncbi:hypothetical protein, partial [Mycetohabitans sp. B3]|uniref:hypothetical protein n=1 Tax=Mycetohabitans sp. B3 TaxID=2841841 RepID=UPI001F26CD48
MIVKRYGLTAEQAREELTIQANLQVQNGSPGEWNQRALEFLKSRQRGRFGQGQRDDRGGQRVARERQRPHR